MSEHSQSASLMWPATFPGSENVDQPHVTVLYGGDKSEIELKPLAALLYLKDLITAPGEVPVTGVEAFGDEDDKVWVAVLDPVSLVAVRETIKAKLEGFGLKDASDFPEYRPHVTLGPHSEEQPEAPESVTLGPLEAWWGDDHISVP